MSDPTEIPASAVQSEASQQAEQARPGASDAPDVAAPATEGAPAAPSARAARAARLKAVPKKSTERVRKWRAAQKEAESAAAAEAPAEQQPEQQPKAAELQQTDDELAASLGRLARFVVKLCSAVAALTRRGRFDSPTRAQELELGRDWLPWAKQFPGLAWVARWVSAPLALVDLLADRFVPAPRPTAAAAETVTGATQPKPQLPPATAETAPATVVRFQSAAELAEAAARGAK